MLTFSIIFKLQESIGEYEADFYHVNGLNLESKKR